MYTSEFEYQIEIFVLSSIDLKQTKLCVLYWHIFFQVRRAILGKKIKATNMGGGGKVKYIEIFCKNLSIPGFFTRMNSKCQSYITFVVSQKM